MDQKLCETLLASMHDIEKAYKNNVKWETSVYLFGEMGFRDGWS